MTEVRTYPIPASLVVGCRFYVVQKDAQGRFKRLNAKIEKEEDTWCGIYDTLEEARAAARKHILDGHLVHGVVQVDTHGQTFHGGIAYERMPEPEQSSESTVRPEGWGEW